MKSRTSLLERVTVCAILLLAFSRVTCGRGESQRSFTSLLQILRDDDSRERRDVEEQEDAESSGGEPGQNNTPKIMESEQKKFVVRKVSKLSVDVGSTVYAVKGTHITVSCKASAAGSQPKVEWLRFGTPMTARFQGDVGAVNGALIIRRLGRFNEGSYTCRASNEVGEAEAIFAAKILVPTLPTILVASGTFKFGPSAKEAVITVGSSVTVYRGTTLTIRCPVVWTGKPVIFWTSKGQSVSIGKAKKVGNDLVISDIDRRFALDYRCTARAPRGRVSATSNVKVLALDPPRIIEGTKTLKIVEGEISEATIDVGSNLTVISETQVTVHCNTSMKPSPAITWDIHDKESLSVSDDNLTLTITDPEVEDTGLYTCTASNNVGQDAKSSYIKILPPEPPKILYSNRKVTLLSELDVLQATIGDQVTLLSGATVSITCPTSGLPAPSITWKKDAEELDPGLNNSYVTRKGELLIRNVTTQHSGVFTCEAVNRAGRFSYSSEFMIIAAKKPEIESSPGRVIGLQGIEEAVVQIGMDLRVVEGLIVRLVCPVKGFPTPQVTWLMNDRTVKASDRFLIDVRTNSLVIDGIHVQDTGQVSCVAENSAGRAEEASFVSILSESSAQILSGNSSIESIKETQTVTIQIGDRLHVLSGSNVFIDCVARGTPPPEVNWRRDGRVVSTGDREGQFEVRVNPEGSRLKIWQFSKEVAGQYECVATNLGGADRVASIITVLEGSSPRIEISSSTEKHLSDLNPVSISAGSRVTLLPGVVLKMTCRASGTPEPTIGWFKQGKPITSTGRFISRGHVLVINSTRLRDKGAYTCIANNSIGQDKHDSTVEVIEPIKPKITETGGDKVVELISRLVEAVGGNIVCIDGVDLELTCSVRGMPAPEILWLHENEVIGKGRKLKLGILKEQNSGNYSCVASNIAGDDRKTTRLRVKTALPPVIPFNNETVESFKEQISLVVDVGARLKVSRGAYIDLICRATGFPTPVVAWVKGNEPLDQRFEVQGLYVIPFNGTSSTLLIRGAQSAQDDEVYGCQASNVAGTDTAFSYVRFYERTTPQIISTFVTGSVGIVESFKSRDPVTIIIGSTLHAFTKTQVTIECPVFAIPEARVEWTKDDRSVPGKHKTNLTNLVLSSNSDVSDSGRYTCVATNALGRDAAYSTVTLIEPTAPRILAGDSSIQLHSTVEYRARVGSNISTLIGNNITLVCDSEGNPDPLIYWKKDGLHLNATEITYTLFASSVNTSGSFSCVAQNLAGYAVSTSRVTVLDAIQATATVPRIITLRESQESTDDRRTMVHIIGGNLTILEGRNLVLRCPVEGAPTPTTSWLFNGSPVQLSDTLQIEDVTGNLKVIEMTEDDVGQYSCVAKNIAGETRELSYAIVVEPTFPVIESSNTTVEWFDPSRKPLTVKVGSKVVTLTGTPVTVTCRVSGFPDPKTSWVKGNPAVTGTDQSRLIVIGAGMSLLDPTPSDSGLYMCTASSPGGQASAVTNITFFDSIKPRIFFSRREQQILDRVSVKLTIGETLEILDQSNVTLECKATGIPPPSIAWSKDGVIELASSTNSYQITDIRPGDSGRYTCTAKNFVGPDSQSSVISVTAGRKPTIKSQDYNIVELDKVTSIKLDIGNNLTFIAGSRVTVLCQADGVPKPVITWKVNEEPLVENTNKADLILEDIELQNLKTVSCMAESVLGSASKASFFIQLAPTKPLVTIPDAPRVKHALDGRPITITVGDNVTALSNTSITIQCPTSGVPRPTITWKKNGQEIIIGDKFAVGDDGSLLIDGADVEDAARYTCTADSDAGQDNASSTVQIVEPRKPSVDLPETGREIPIGDGSPVTMNIGDNVTAASETHITIKCPVSGVPKPTVSWDRDGVQISPGETFSITSDNSLVIQGATVEESTKYTCSVRSIAGNDSASSSVKIVGHSKPVVKLPVTPREVDARDGNPVTVTVGDNVTALSNTSITIQCPTSGVPRPTITWTKDGQEIIISDKFAVRDDGSLLIDGADVEDAARYTCTADSDAGQDNASSTVQIVEPRKPSVDLPEAGREIPIGDGSPVTMNIGDNVTAASETHITIKCPVSGIPKPTVSWDRDGVQISPGETFSITSDNSLVIQGATVEESAKYTCSVRSIAGNDSASSSVKIVGHSKPVVKLPVTPREVDARDGNPVTVTVGDNVTALSNTSITIQCPTSGVPRPTVTWTKDGQEIIIGDKFAVGDDGSLLINGADVEDAARYTCTADSVAGKDNASSTVQIVEPRKPSVDLPETGREIPIGDGSPVTMNIGDNVTAASETHITIKCPVSGIPKPTVSWDRDGVQISPGETFSITSDNSLVIQGATVEESAKYTCSVRSIAGNDSASSSVKIVGHSKPVVKLPVTPREVDARDGNPVTVTVGDNVTALSNTSITIQCPTSGVPRPTITWTKDGQEIIISDKFAVRDDGSLLIDGADVEDAARYTCTADSDAGQDNASSTVQIVEPRKPSVDLPETGREIPIGDGSPVTMNIGDNVTAASETHITIKCPVSGVPKPTVSWDRDGVQISPGETFSITSDNSLVIQGATVEESAKYTCSVRSIAGNDSASSSVKIVGHSKPVVKLPVTPREVDARDGNPVTVTVGDNVTALSNTSITIQCPTSGVPRPTITWTKDGQEIIISDKFAVGDDGSLLIDGADVEDAARYTCTADSDAGQDNASSTVQIVEPRKPSVDLPETGREIPIGDGSPVTMNIGDNVTAASETHITIKCPVSGIPKPTVSWDRDGVQISPGETFSITSDNSLVIQGATVEESAKYTCSVRSIAGNDSASSSVKIVGHSKPVVKLPVTPREVDARDGNPVIVTVGDNVTALSNTSITIQCPTSGVPRPTITWTKDGQEIIIGDKFQVGDDGSLLIDGADVEDAARYTCTADSDAGQDNASSTVQIVEPRKPSVDLPETGREIPIGDGSPVTMNIGDNVTAASETHITIKCPVSGVPKPTVSWDRDGIQISPGETFSITSDNSLVIQGATVEESAKYTCSVRSIAGNDSASSSVKIVGHSKPVVKLPVTPREVDARDGNPVTVTVGDNVTAFSNTSITIQCPTSGVPRPTITWTKDGQEIIIGDKFAVGDDGSLLIDGADVEDAARYTCTADSDAGQDNASSTVQIVEPRKPSVDLPETGREIPIGDGSPVTMNIGDNVTAASETHITIKCPVSGVPKPTVSWDRDGVQISPGETFSITSENSLVIQGATVEESAKYTCSVRSIAGNDSASSSVKIVGHSKPVVKLPVTPREVDARDGNPVIVTVGDNVTALSNTSITIQCPTSGVPRPTITWTKDGQEIIIGDKFAVGDDGSLLIDGADVEDAARYTCTADSDAGQDNASSTVQIVEPRKPSVDLPETGREIPIGDGSPVTMNIGDNVTAASETHITIKCPVSGVPKPTVSWDRDGVQISPGETFSITSDNSLVIQGATVEESAKYTCSVRSIAGNDSASSSVKIVGHSKPVVKLPVTPREVDARDGNPVIVTVGDNVTALSNTSITIQCPTSGVPRPTVTWTKDGQEIIIGDKFAVGDDGSLLIDGADVEDAARYTCTADSHAGLDNASSTVQIVEPRKPSVDLPETGREIPIGDGSPVTMNIGDNVTAASETHITIKCPVSGVPKPTVSWDRDGVQISPGETFSITSDNSLVIQGATVEESAKYTCSVRSIAGNDSASSSVKIVEPVPPRIISSVGDLESLDQDPVNIIIGQNLLTLTESQLSISCPVRGVPTPRLTWTKRNKSLPSDGRMAVRNGTLVIAELEPGDSGKYTCSAENAEGTVTASSNVTVVAPSPAEIRRTGIEDLHVLELMSINTTVGSSVLTISGNNVTLSCGVDGFPPPSVEWMKDNNLLDVKGHSLSITSTTTNDSGSYTCIAKNLFGVSDSLTTNLTVIDLQRPTVVTSNHTLEVLEIRDVSEAVGGAVTTLDGNTVSLRCEVSGVPTPRITWKKGGKEVQSGGEVYIIDSAGRNDSGIYTCTASNIGGDVIVHTNLSVLVGFAPTISASQETIVQMEIDFFTITIGSNLTTLASSGLEITCPASGFPKPTIGWYREGEPVQPGMMLKVDNTTGTLATLSISHRKGGTFTCRASNVRGFDIASSVVTVLAAVAPQINVSAGTVKSLESRDPLFIRIGQAIAVLSGTTISVECPANGVPKPSVSWSLHNEPLSSGGRVLVEDSKLIITNVTSEDSGVYYCKAVNLAGDIIAGSILNVTETASPKISFINQSQEILGGGAFTVDIGSSVTTVGGNTVTMRCNASGVPSPRITWSKDGISLNAEGRLLVVSELTLSDAGRYQCAASNIDGTDVQEIYLEVLVGSAPRIITSERNIVDVSGVDDIYIEVGGNITTVIGTGVEIACPVTGLPSVTVTWLFNGSKADEGERRFVSPTYESFVIIVVTPGDVGYYTCLANNSLGSDSKTTFLSVIVPVEPKIFSSNKNIKDFNAVEYQLTIGDNLETLEGVTVSITCPATGTPVPTTQWKKSGEVIHSNNRLKAVNNSLVLYDVTPSDTGSYTCTVTNSAGADEKATFLTFRAPNKPSITGDSIDIESYDRQPVTVPVGGTLKVLDKTKIEVNCVASGIPAPSIYWNKGDTYNVSDGGSLLSFREVDVSDSGEYTCRAVNKAGEDTRATVIEVFAPILPTIRTSTDNISWYDKQSRSLAVGGILEVLSGTNVTLQCKNSGFPQPEVQWTVREGNAVEPTARYEVINGSLVVLAAQPSDSGQYICRVQNLAGSASAATQLAVIEPRPPSIMPLDENIVSLSDRLPVKAVVGSTITVLSGSTVTVTCAAEGIPTPTVTWSRQDGAVTTPLENKTAMATAVLIIENASTDDSGDYLCTAKSGVGLDQETTKITVIEPSQPTIPQPEVDNIPLTNKTSIVVQAGSNVTVLTNTRVNITCDVSGVPKPNITWLKSGKPLNSPQDSFLIVTIKTLEDAGRYTCFAENVAGNVTSSSDIKALEPVFPRIISKTGVIMALTRRQAVTSSVGVTVETFTSTSVTLKCSSEGSPTPIVSWRKGGQLLVSKERTVIEKNGTLTIRSTRAEDTGRYQCSARSPIGEATVASSLYIVAPIRPSIRKSKSYIIWYEKQPFRGKIGDNLTTMKGRMLTLVCPAVGLPRPSILWYRGGMRMRSGGSYHISGQTLIMYNLDVTDTDRYTCVARNFAGVTSATTTIKVHEPMAPEIITSYGSVESLQDLKRLNVTIGMDATLLGGSPLTIKCPVIGVPEPKITWVKNRKLLTSNERMEVDCNGTLNIFSADPQDSGDYICSADSFLGMDLAFSAITVIDAVKPSVDVSQRVLYISSARLVDLNVGDNLTAITTTPVNISCPAKGIPTPNVFWLMNGEPIDATGNYRPYGNGVLVIKGLKDPGEYTCIAENFIGKDDASSYITILGPSKPVVKLSATPREVDARDGNPVTMTVGDNVTALSNTSITIQCPTTGVPRPTVTWKKDGQEIIIGERFTVGDDGSLLIDGADVEDAARYTCTADSDAGQDSASSTVHIVEPRKPSVELPETGREIPIGDGSPVIMNIGDNVTAASETHMTIKCPVSGVPKPIVSWDRDGVQITPGETFLIAIDNSLVIQGATVEDSAKYTCSVRSVAGTDSASSSVKIVGTSKPVVKLPVTPREVDARDGNPVTMTVGDNVTALSNTSITIECPTSGVPRPIVTWTKDGQEIISDEKFTVGEDGSLLINGADVEDNARYTCTADSDAGQDSASSTVQVIEPRKPSVELPETGREIPIGDGSPVIMNIGDNVTAASETHITIKCPVSGVPKPIVSWDRDGVQITPGETFLIASDNSLVIQGATVEDSAKYTCSVRSVAGTDSASSSVKIVGTSKPVVKLPVTPREVDARDGNPVTMTVGDNVTALSNTSITIECPTSGVPRPIVTWTKDGQEIIGDEKFTVGEDGSLLINGADVEDNARYTCTADSDAGHDSASSTVQIVEPRKPSVELPETGREIPIGDGSPVTMNIGDNVTAASETHITIKCPVSGVPKPIVSWDRDGVQITPGETFLIAIDNSLVIQGATVEDSAKYTCSVRSVAGTDSASSSVKIVGTSKPVVKLPVTPREVDARDGNPVTMTVGDNVTALSNTSITIECPTSGVPRPIVTWTKDGQEIISDEKFTVGEDGSLLINGADVEDNARYTCTADSDSGQDSASSTVQIVEPRKPSVELPETGREIPIGDGSPVTMNIGDNVTAASETHITIKCPVSGVPKPIVSWDRDGVQITPGETFLIASDNSLVIQGATVEDSAKYTCSVRSVAGTDSASSSVKIVGTSKPVVKLPVTPREVDARDGNPVTMTVGDNVTSLSNTSITIECPTSGVPRPIVTWTKDGQEIISDEKFTVGEDGSLLINGADVEDNARYTCTADSDSGQDSASSTVQIVEPRKPSVELPETGREIPIGDGSPVTMNIGDNVTAASETHITIKCPVSGIPKPTVSWDRDGVQITPGETFLIASDNSLVIQGATVEDSAKYTCSVRSVAGTDSASSSVKIVGTSKPVVKLPVTPREVDARDGNPVTMTVGDNVTALSNTSITIECPTSGVPRPIVTWTKDGQEIISDEKFTVGEDGSLLINGADVEDNARYTCSADSDSGQDSASSTVQIIEPRKPSVELPETGREIPIGDGSPVIMNIGDNVTAASETHITIKCPVSGIPKPTVSWDRDGVQITPGETFLIASDNSLVIQGATVEDSAKYTCSVRSVAGTDSASSSVKIVDLQKPTITVPSPGPEVSAGDGSPVVTPVGSQITEFAYVTISLTCPTEGVPPPSVTWTKDGEKLSSIGQFVIDKDGTLTIRDAIEEDSGKYTCSAESVAGVSEVTSSIDILELLAPIIQPPVGTIVSDDHKRITAGVGTRINAFIGATILVNCAVRGVPEPEVSWSKDGQKVLTGGKVLLVSNGTIIIQDSSMEDSGEYTCSASSRAGQDNSTSSVSITALSKPSIERSKEKVSWNSLSLLTVAVGNSVEIINGSTVKLRCVSSELPPPQLKWTRGIQELSSSGRFTITEQSLTITNIQHADADEYTCTATNEAGQDVATTELVIIEPGRPIILPVRKNVVDVDASRPVVVTIGASLTTVVNATVIIRCPSQGTPPPIISWNYNQIPVVSGAKYNMSGSSLVIARVQREDEGRYVCTAFSKFGRDSESLVLTVTVPPVIDNVKGTFEITDIRDLVSITTGAVVTIPIGVSIKIQCMATGVPFPNITWYRQTEGSKQRALLSPSSTVKLLDDNSISILHTDVADAADYTCVATNIAGQDEGTTMLNIGIPPAIPSHWKGVRSRFREVAGALETSIGAVATVIKGATLNIKCAAVGTPKPQITWVVAAAGRQKRYHVLTDGTLEVPSADLEDEGNYTCIANNSYGTLNRTTSVSILVPPEILERHFRHIMVQDGLDVHAMAQLEVKRNKTSSITIEKGHDMIIICTVSGKPKPHVSWRRNRVLIRNDTRHLVLPNGVLLVHHVDMDESGQYKCVASNVVGKDQGTVELTVKDKVIGHWKAMKWSECGSCVGRLRGWQERSLSCVSSMGDAVNHRHCTQDSKPITRRQCTSSNCQVIWWTSAWSACSLSCGSHGIKLRNVNCVFAKSRKPSQGLCNLVEKPAWRGECNRISCKGNCKDKVNYCQRVKRMGMCPVYARWCCNTC